MTKLKVIGSVGWPFQYMYETETQDKHFVNIASGVGKGMFKDEALRLQAIYTEF